VKPKAVGTTQIIQAPLVGGEPRHFTTPSLITGGVAIVGLGLGVGFGLATRSKYNSCNDHAATCTDGQKSTIKNYGHIADAGWALGLAGAIATTVLYATSGKEPHVEVAPNAAGGATVSAFGRF
jgi:hypothetical protein